MKDSLIRKAVPPARMGLNGLPVWEWEQRKESSREVWSISSAGVVELRIHVSVSVMMSGL